MCRCLSRCSCSGRCLCLVTVLVRCLCSFVFVCVACGVCVGCLEFESGVCVGLSLVFLVCVGVLCTVLFEFLFVVSWCLCRCLC